MTDSTGQAIMQVGSELHVPLLAAEPGDGEIISEHAGSLPVEGDVEQGLQAGSEADRQFRKSEEDLAIETAARASCQCGPLVYIADILRLSIFYWAIVSDALLMKELYSNDYVVLGGISSGFTAGTHVIMSVLLIIRQGWLQAASQACGFILTLNPFESLTPIPQGILGLFVISIGFIAYVLIAASGLIFVAYCVLCYLVTALLFSLLILDLATLVVTVAPSKGIFKYTDLVYTENFKFSRLLLQAWLQSAPELVLISVILYRNWSTEGPAVVINGAILWQALAAHAANLWDKSYMFKAAAAFTGAGAGQHLLSVLQVKGACRLSLPVLRENLNKVLRGTGGTEAALGSVVHITSAEEAPDTDSDAAASMVPEYLTPTNGGLLSPGQLMALARTVFGRYGGLGVAELVLEVTPDVMVGKLLLEVIPTVPSVSTVRLVNASLRGRDAAGLAAALLQCSSLRRLQLHSVLVDEKGAAALTQLLEHTPTLQQLDLCRCKLRRKAPQALAHGLRGNRTLRQLNLAGCKGLDDAGASAIAAAVACSKVLSAVNLAFVKLGSAAIDSLVQALNSSSSLRVLAVSQSDVTVEGGRKLIAAIAGLQHPKAPPSLSCNLNLGTFPVEGLDKVQWLAVQDQDAVIADAWQGLLEPDAGDTNDTWVSGSVPAAQHPGIGLSGGTLSEVQGLVSNASGIAGAVQLEIRAGDEDVGAVEAAEERAPLLSSTRDRSRSSSSGVHATAGNRAQRPPAVSTALVHHPTSAFGVTSPTPAAAAATSTLPSAAAAWFSSSHGSAAAQQPSSTAAAAGTSSVAISSKDTAASCSKDGMASCSSTATGFPNCPTLVFVVTEEDVIDSMVKSSLLFQELDTLDLTGLGIADAGAIRMAKVLEDSPAVRRVILADNKIGEEGGAALAGALGLNTTLQVLDLSGNELSDTAVAVLADSTRDAPGLRQLRLLGNKIPFGLATLRRLVEAEIGSPHCHLVLVEDPAEVLDQLEKDADTQQAARAAEFFKHQEQYRQQRRQRMLAKQQRRQQLEQKLIAAEAAAAAARETANEGSGVSTGASTTAAAAASAAAAAAATVVPAQDQQVVPSSPLAGQSSQPGSVSSVATDEDICGICFDNSNHVAIKYCGHRLCVDCYRKVWELSGLLSTCPFCRARLEGYLYLDWPLET